MKSTVHHIINQFHPNEDISYLELGLSSGINFNSLVLKNKKSVDIVSDPRPTFQMSTDDFFKNNKEKFHIIYIDADHEYQQVIKDYNNAVDSITINGIIFLHDLYPPDKDHTQKHLCDNSFKILNYFIDNNYNILVNLGDYGACAVFSNSKINLENFNHDITYEDFVKKNNTHESLCGNYEQFSKIYKNKILSK